MRTLDEALYDGGVVPIAALFVVFFVVHTPYSVLRTL